MTQGKSDLQKASLTLEQLPPLTIINGKTGYYVKYRIISEDRNKVSHWSPTYAITAPYEFRRPTGIPLDGIKYFETNTGGSNKVVTLAWDPVDVYNGANFIRKAIAYDVWHKWDGGDWTYEARVSNPSLTVVVPTPNPGTLSVEIYARSLDISRDAAHQILLLYKRDNMAV